MSAVLPAHGWRELEVCAANIPGRLSHHELLKKAVALNAKLSTFDKNTITVAKFNSFVQKYTKNGEQNIPRKCDNEKRDGGVEEQRV